MKLLSGSRVAGFEENSLWCCDLGGFVWHEHLDALQTAWGGEAFPWGSVCSVGEWPQGQKGDLIKELHANNPLCQKKNDILHSYPSPFVFQPLSPCSPLCSFLFAAICTQQKPAGSLSFSCDGFQHMCHAAELLLSPLCPALCHLLVNPCPTALGAAAQAVTDGRVNSLWAGWKSFPHSVKPEKNGSQAVLCFSGISPVCIHHVSIHLSVKQWESGWETLLGVNLCKVQLRRWTWVQFAFPLGCESPAWLRTARLSLSFFHYSLAHAHHQSLCAINLSEEETALSELFLLLHWCSAKGHVWSGTSELALDLRKCCEEGAGFSDSLFPLHWALEAPAWIYCLVLSAVHQLSL